MKIEQHISDLLYRYDCVIVPGLGGFVANYGPSKVHPVHHTFSPPTKEIVFNKNLTNNDGLLTHSIASSENISYADAGKLIHFFVMNIQHDLKSKKKVMLKEIGTLFHDKEYNLQFEPDINTNYLVDSFGLAPVQSPPIKRETLQKKIEKKIEKIEQKFMDREPIPQERKKPKINTRKYVAYAIAGAAIITALVIIPIKTNMLKDFNYSSLNPFADKSTQYKHRTEPAYEFNEENFRQQSNEESDLVITENTSGTNPDETPVVAPHKATAESTAVAVTKPEGEQKYHVVTGCFRIRENADKYVSQLLNRGINASVIGRNDEGLYIVSSGNFSNQVKARAALDSIRNTAAVAAWLLVK